MTPETPIAVRVENLVKRFATVRALDAISFSVNRGEIFGLVGPDGAGKTTTLRILAGLLKPDEGVALVAGHDLVSDGDALRHDISYMPQRFGLYEELSVDENIHFHADLFGISRRMRDEHATRLLEACGMSEFRRRLAGRLSGGMKQKLSLVCALIHEPKVLLLDEPTSGVDPVSRREFWMMLYDLVGAGVTVVVSTAYLDEAERCHRLGLIYKGRLLLCDTPELLKARLPAEVIAVVSSMPDEVEKALASDRQFSHATVVGNEVHLLIDDAGNRVAQVRSMLEASHCAFEEIFIVEPSIEDLFVNAVAAESHFSAQ
jgi:ABC-2 type transport system ATP-binding protein